MKPAREIAEEIAFEYLGRDDLGEVELLTRRLTTALEARDKEHLEVIARLGDLGDKEADIGETLRAERDQLRAALAVAHEENNKLRAQLKEVLNRQAKARIILEPSSE